MRFLSRFAQAELRLTGFEAFSDGVCADIVILWILDEAAGRAEDGIVNVQHIRTRLRELTLMNTNQDRRMIYN